MPASWLAFRAPGTRLMVRPRVHLAASASSTVAVAMVPGERYLSCVRATNRAGLNSLASSVSLDVDRARPVVERVAVGGFVRGEGALEPLGAEGLARGAHRRVARRLVAARARSGQDEHTRRTLCAVGDGM